LFIVTRVTLNKIKMAILIFDLPIENASEKVKLNRELHEMKAIMVQHSAWSSENVPELIRIASEIKKLDGRARILEERFVF
jgi:hypothetical protein